ncbi:hypothetical protein D3C87_1292430 [compost metagenome]
MCLMKIVPAPPPLVPEPPRACTLFVKFVIEVESVGRVKLPAKLAAPFVEINEIRPPPPPLLIIETAPPLAFKTVLAPLPVKAAHLRLILPPAPEAPAPLSTPFARMLDVLSTMHGPVALTLTTPPPAVPTPVPGYSGFL